MVAHITLTATVTPERLSLSTEREYHSMELAQCIRNAFKSCKYVPHRSSCHSPVAQLVARKLAAGFTTIDVRAASYTRVHTVVTLQREGGCLAATASPACLQIHRIQNKKLWKLSALHHGNMQERWSHEPDLHLANGGLPQLWHGTGVTEPHKVYATEQGEGCCLV